MLTHESLRQACINLELNPDERGNSILASSRDLSLKSEIFDLDTIHFPEEEMNQVLEIGKIINNLISQYKFPGTFDLTNKKGKLEYYRNGAIDKIMPTLQKSANFWLKRGLEKLGQSELRLEFHNGLVFEVDPKYYESMEKMTEQLEEFRRDFRIKEAASIEAARKTFLC